MNTGRIVRILLPASVILAAAAFATGFFLPAGYSERVLEMLQDYLKGVPFTYPGLFLNNVAAALILFAGGFLLALPSLASFYLNFLVLGTVFRSSINAGRAGLFAAGVLPHGVFEIPAVIISFALGLALAFDLVERIAGRRQTAFRKVFADLARVFALTVLPLLALAAALEVWVTPLILRSLQ